MTERCPHCSFNPTNLNDYCDKHRPEPTLRERAEQLIQQLAPLYESLLAYRGANDRGGNWETHHAETVLERQLSDAIEAFGRAVSDAATAAERQRCIAKIRSWGPLDGLAEAIEREP